MNTTHKLEIEWDDYIPSPAMQEAVDYLNRRTLEEIMVALPTIKMHPGRRVTFGYRVYSQYDLRQVEIVYIMLNGFAECADTPDSGIKNLLTDLLLRQTESRKYAVLVVGGLFSFSAAMRRKLFRQGSGALTVIAEEVADLLTSKFGTHQIVTVSGYSLGGVLAPLVARVIDERKIATVEQVCCGEPSYAAVASTRIQLLKRVAHATAYRNDQIKATTIQAYIAVKQTPDTKWAVLVYGARQYRPLLRRLLSMCLIVQDLALQARTYPPESCNVQVQEALSYLAKRGLQVNLLHAEFSSLCHGESFAQLVDSLMATESSKLSIITIRGTRADHGIEECRTLSTPFLVRPEMYWPTSK